MSVKGKRLGLGDKWRSVVLSIERLGEDYPAINHLISLWTDVKLRRLGVIMGGRQRRVIDIGAGDGSLSKEIEAIAKPEHLVLLDPLEAMLRRALRALSSSSVDAMVSVIERSPFRDSRFDVAYMAFSMRDFVDLERGLSSIVSLLRPRGKLIIVELGKPRSSLLKLLLRVYWSLVAPLLASLASPRKGLSVRVIADTLERMPDNKELLLVISKHAKLERVVYKLLGYAQVIEAVREG